MFNQLKFYLTHSLNDLSINKRLTFFALLSIAAGVAAIVSLQTLSIMIDNTVSNNLQQTNQGDVQASIAGSDGEDIAIYDELVEDGILVEEENTVFGQTFSSYNLTLQGLEAVETWITESGYADQVDITYQIPLATGQQAFIGRGNGTSVTADATGENISQVISFVVDPASYPFYGEILTTDNQPLDDVLQTPTDIVLSTRIADEIDVEVGELVRIDGANEPFTVRGIVTPEEGLSGSGDSLIAGFFGFYYIGHDAIAQFEDVDTVISSLYFQLDDPSATFEFDAALSEEFIFLSTTSTEDVREQNEALTNQISQLLTTVGLVSLLIGSIGIINTMQVIVRRRMLEVAVLKTIGMQGEQITILFLTEAFLLGVIGSLFGIVLGWIATFALQSAAQAVTTTTLVFVLAPSPAINGFIMGIAVATVFGFLPTLAASQVRPGLVIRPQDRVVPRAGRLQSLLVLALIIVVIAIITQTILGQPFWIALGVVAGAFLIAGVIYAILWVIIWFVGRFFPSFGLIDLKVSLRQMLASKGRGASTLLALVVGVFSLSTITLFAQSINSVLANALQAEGNVLVSVQNYGQLDEVTTILDGLDGVEDYNITLTYTTELVQWEDSETGEVYTADDLEAVLIDADLNFPPIFDGTDEERLEIQTDILESTFVEPAVTSLEITEETEQNLAVGRAIPVDAESPLLVYADDPLIENIGVSPGDLVTYDLINQGLFTESREQITFEVAGIAAPQVSAFSTTGTYASASVFPENIDPTGVAVNIDITEEQIPDLRVALAEIPGTFVLETAFLTQFITSILAQFTAFPTLVATLGLVVGGVVIANSVALATMERRNEIAVMKSVGLQRERVLGMLLIENGILGFIGGLIGVGIGLVAVIGLAASSDSPLSTIPWGTAFLLMLLCVGVAVLAALTSAWSASGEKPLTVLRYE